MGLLPARPAGAILVPMIPRFALFAALAALFASPAWAAERRVQIGSFERLRVEGPFEVRVTTGRSPGGGIVADPHVIERIEVRVDGTTLVVRMGSDGWGERPRVAVDAPPVITLSTPSLAAATVFAGGKVTVTRMKGTRLDLAVSGAGQIALEQADAEQVNATLIGTGSITLGGRTSRARLLSNGPGTIDAGDLQADQLVVNLDGSGETRAQARYTAQVTNTGLGRVIIAGNAKCTVKAAAGGPVSCGPNL